MIFSYPVILLVIVATTQAAQPVDWKGDNWATGCEFRGNDLMSVQTSSEQCGSRCVNTEGCTHFTWTTRNGGTCYMKSGGISQADAVNTGDSTQICGIPITWTDNWAEGCSFTGNDILLDQMLVMSPAPRRQAVLITLGPEDHGDNWAPAT